MRHHARGWCSVHYQRWKAHGNAEAPVQDYTYRLRRKPPDVIRDRVFSVRLTADAAARADYSAAVAGLTRNAWLRHIIHQSTGYEEPTE